MASKRPGDGFVRMPDHEFEANVDLLARKMTDDAELGERN